MDKKSGGKFMRRAVSVLFGTVLLFLVFLGVINVSAETVSENNLPTSTPVITPAAFIQPMETPLTTTPPNVALGATPQPTATSQPTATPDIAAIAAERIKEMQSQISKTEDEKKKLQSGLSDIQKIKKELEEKKSSLLDYVRQLDGTLSDIEAKIEEINRQMIQKETEIEETQKELEAAIIRENNQKELLAKHIGLMYECGDSYIIEILAKSSGFCDFLNRADFLEDITRYDKGMWDSFIQLREYTQLCEQELNAEKELLNQSKITVETEQKNLENLIEQKNKDITGYQTDIKTKEAAIKDYEASIAQEEEEIKALEAAIAEQKRKIIENNGAVLTYDGGVFKFPLASYTRISDEYGYRIHPTLGVRQFHNGVDFASPAGTAIYAAYDGEVAAAAYSTSMGNYVMIDHGGGLYTIYMHASKLYVSKGDAVARGDTIAAVGSTGRSTGNHLHFSVRKDGEYVSPWEYISK